MKKMLTVFLGWIILSNVYAINIPSSEQSKTYNGAAFVNQARKASSTTTAECPVSCPQKTPISVNKEVIQKIVKREVDSANANQIEQLLGPACSCFTVAPSSDAWTCQWKGNLASNRLENTINVTFEGGMLAGVIAIANDGVTYTATPNSKVKVYQPQ